jgi:hypothetical protein
LAGRKYGESVPIEVITDVAERIQNLYGVPKARAMRLATRALETYESKGGWVDGINEEIQTILKVVVPVWIENGSDADAVDSWFEGNTLVVGEKRLPMDYPIHQVIEYSDFIIVLYAYDSYKGRGRFSNLVAVNRNGEEIWKADHPVNAPTSAYVEMVNEDPLVAWNFAGYRCTIDINNGKIIEAVFTK